MQLEQIHTILDQAIKECSPLYVFALFSGGSGAAGAVARRGGSISSLLPYDSFPWHVGRWQGGGIGAVCGGAPSGVLLGPFLARAKYIAPLNLQRSKVVRVTV